MSFGQSAALYNDVRQPYASEVIEEVAGILGAPSGQRLIDLGCGTGIATRQLSARGFNVLGADVDADMIEEASSRGEAAGYFVMSVDQLDFPDGGFNGATAFGAFHWFCDDVSVREIKRVLQPGGRFIVVNKYDNGTFRQVIVEIVSRHVTLTLAQPRAGYHPADILKRGGFRDVEERALPSIERLPAEAAISYVRSMRLWQEVPLSLHDSIEEELRGYVWSRIDESGYFPRPIATSFVFGRK